MYATAQTTDYQHVLMFDVFPLKIDFSKIIEDIKQSGMNYSQQAVSIGRGFSTLQRWKNGAQPQFTTGHALLILHTKICGPEKTHERINESQLLD